MSTFTSSLGLEEIAPGTQAGLWGDSTNNNLNLIDQAVTGVTPISFASLSGSIRTLTDFNGAADEARSAVLNITGAAAGANTIIVPNKQKTYLVRNSTGQDVIFQTPTPGSTFTVGAGNSILVFCDGNNNVFTGIASPNVGTLGVASGGTGSTTFTAGFVKSSGGTNALTSAASVNLASGEVTGALTVFNGGTGASTFSNGGLLRGNGTGAVDALVGGAAGQLCTWNGSQWTAATPASGGVTSVFGRVGAVTAQVGDYSAFYYPLSTNPSGFITNAAISNMVTTDTPQNITAIKTFIGGATGDQRIQITGGGFTGGLAAGALQLGVAGIGVTLGTVGGANALFGVNGSAAHSLATNGDFAINGSSAQAFKPGGGSWAAFSDVRLKTNVTSLTGALDKILSLNPVSYSWKSAITEPTVGFVAQEVRLVLPTAVSETSPTEEQEQFISDDKLLAVGFKNDMTAYLVGAIKELKAELDIAKAEIAALKAQ